MNLNTTLSAWLELLCYTTNDEIVFKTFLALVSKVNMLSLFCTGLFYIWGISFMLITTLIAFFKKEKDNRLEDNHVKLNIFQNYSLLWDILKIPSIRVLAIALLTSKVNTIKTIFEYFTTTFCELHIIVLRIV